MKKSFNMRAFGIILNSIVLVVMSSCCCRTTSVNECTRVDTIVVHDTVRVMPQLSSPTVMKTASLSDWESGNWHGLRYRAGHVDVSVEECKRLIIYMHGGQGYDDDRWFETIEHGHHQILDFMESRKIAGTVVMPLLSAGQSWASPSNETKMVNTMRHKMVMTVRWCISAGHRMERWEYGR